VTYMLTLEDFEQCDSKAELWSVSFSIESYSMCMFAITYNVT